MKLLHSLHRRQIVRSYSARNEYVNVDFVIEQMKCHKDDKHEVKGLDTEAEVPPFTCSFNNSLLQGHMLAVADEEGGVCLYDVRKQGPPAKLKGWLAHSNAIFDIAWVCNEPKLVTASGDQTAQLWDIQQSTKVAVFKGHSCSLKSVDFQCENLFVFATGARDGNVMVWDMRCNKRDGYYKPVNTIHNCHSTLATTGTPQRNNRRGRRRSSSNSSRPDSQQSVTSVIFQDINTVISAGAVDGNIKVWDLRKNYSTIRTEPLPYHAFPYPGSGTRKHGYSSLSLDSTKSKLFANCTNDIIYMYDCVTYQKQPLATFRGHSNATFYVKSCISPNDQYLISGSGDCDGYIWRVDDPTAAPFHLTGHTNEVTSVAWCPTDETKVVTCSDDNSLKVWRVDYAEKNNGDFFGWCERKPNPKLPDDVKDDLSNKIKNSLQTSPIQSRSNSAAGSPVSLSPNPTKCRSPQQFLQDWLQLSEKRSPRVATNATIGDTNNESPSCSKRPRDMDSSLKRSKRVCLENVMKKNEVKNSEFDTPECLGENNKENMAINLNTQVRSEQTAYTTLTKVSEMQRNIETNQPECTKVTTNQGTDQSECKNTVTKQNTKKSNWLRDMGVKKKNLNKVSRKVKTSSQPSSPLQQEPSSPSTDVGAMLKNTRSIKDYFTPVSCGDHSPREHCLR